MTKRKWIAASMAVLALIACSVPQAENQTTNQTTTSEAPKVEPVIAPEPAKAPEPIPGIDSLSNYSPDTAPDRLTDAQRYRADIAFWANAPLSLSFDEKAMYNEVRPMLCKLLDNPEISVADIEALTADNLRRAGQDEGFSNRWAKAAIKVTTQSGQCDDV